MVTAHGQIDQRRHPVPRMACRRAYRTPHTFKTMTICQDSRKVSIIKHCVNIHVRSTVIQTPNHRFQTRTYASYSLAGNLGCQSTRSICPIILSVLWHIACGSRTISGHKSYTEDAPRSLMAVTISLRNICTIFTTPATPYTCDRVLKWCFWCRRIVQLTLCA